MPPYLPRAMRHKMLQVFPQLDGRVLRFHLGRFRRDHRRTHARCRPRHAKRVSTRRVIAGTGVALSGIVGKIIAEAIAGQAEHVDLFAKLPHMQFPGGAAFRTPLLAAAMLWYRLRDLL